ncbi:TIR domain-containing protein [Phycisphaerales bacterium AB-hyl4]|uniref:TIR domain-containing protein n=1 Tax=Natronomicrosphaera hydrolytica TaxID=3242702 RepID=A0ABV4U869_9BACT
MTSKVDNMTQTIDKTTYRLLTQVKSDFDRLRWQARPIRAQLIHRATNAEAEGVVGIPAIQGDMIAMQGAGHREAFQRLDKNGNAIFRDDPILDVKGNPITNSAGEAFDVVMPAFRKVSFTGVNKDYGLLAGLAERAGRIVTRLGKLPFPCFEQGWQFSQPSDLWWSLIFEIAWSGRHPLLVADKRIWLPDENPHSFVPYDLQQLKFLAQPGPGPTIAVPDSWLNRLPDAWVSEIEDTVAASFDVADFLLTKLTPEDPEEAVGDDTMTTELYTNMQAFTPIRRRFAVALSFPGGHRKIVQEIADALRPVFGEQRIFYDYYHQAELSRPNLDLQLQEIYSKESDLVVVFVCGEYKEKEWTGLEWRAIRELMKSNARTDDDIMFVRLDNQDIPGLLSIDGYMDLAKQTPREVADGILKRWAAKR